MYDMTIKLQGGRRLYEQIYGHIRDEIREGRLLCGERLPSTRALAEYLQVSRNTVEAAYEQLISEGYIESRPYKGYFVCRIEELFVMRRGRDAGDGAVRRQEGGGMAAGKAAESKMDNPFLCDFYPNGIDMSGFPFGVWQRITRNVLGYDNQELFALGEPQGDVDLRATICRYLHSSRGVNCSPQQIVIGAGNDYLLMLLEKILGDHIRIAMENPSYRRACRIFRSFGYDIVSVGMDESGMRADELGKSGASAAYVMPSHQYPTGIVMPIGRRLELLKWAGEESERYLIEDDYDSEFRYRGKPIPSLQASDAMGKVIYIGTFSKAIAPAIRVSYMVLPDRLLQVYRERCFFYSSTVSRIDQRILNEFIGGGYFERYLNKVRKIYREKHDVLLEQLRPFQKEFALSGENAGLHVLLTSRRGRGEKQLLDRAREQGVKVYGMSDAYIKEAEDGGPDSHTVILGYGDLSPDQICRGVERLKKAWLE
ncbi:MAG: PLP-dependent aminotransferase family protein [Lachnospiraceae bacterium]|nr:PLP-dependent aminotransferase family protein [Lachnospiraceae bacterium]